MKDPRRPIGTFLLLGPTGVGKTLLAQDAGGTDVWRYQSHSSNST
ncbi:MAG: hypothetical protein QM813_27190 [Verrucomicrobiota bacterium]